MSDFCFRSISLEQIDRISPNYKLTHLGWDCYLSFFAKFVTELCHLMDVRISFLLNLFRTWSFYRMKSAAAGLYSDSLTILV